MNPIEKQLILAMFDAIEQGDIRFVTRNINKVDVRFDNSILLRGAVTYQRYEIVRALMQDGRSDIHCFEGYLKRWCKRHNDSRMMKLLYNNKTQSLPFTTERTPLLSVNDD